MGPENSIHTKWMARCLELARRGAGRVSPNPMVGSVIVGQNGTVLGEGWHREFGGPHAERNAIEAAEKVHGPEVLKRATLYVNLEPCSHYGKTPPCSLQIIEKQIPRVVVGMIDPYERVSGKGIAALKAHGVEVCYGIMEQDCQRLNRAFTHHLATGRPLVTLKMAQTLDGYIATASGDSKWVSGKAARTLVHQWRAELDAVLIGSGTALADNPSLTVRHVSGRHPWRVVLDRSGRLPADLRLFTDDFAAQTIAVTGPAAAPAYQQALEAAGGRVLQLPEKEGHMDLHAVLQVLGNTPKNSTYENSAFDSRRAFQSVLVEAGPGLATALFEADLVDRFKLFIAPKIIGAGIPALHDLAITRMKDARTFTESHWQQVGEDMLFEGYRGGAP